MALVSVYSEHRLNMPVSSGTAVMSVDTDVVDFGVFQKGTTSSRALVLCNTGNVAVAFRIHPPKHPDLLDFTLYVL